ncbi:MAG: DUF1553 domain-containing protein [Isosphaeraceae bacterium]
MDAVEIADVRVEPAGNEGSPRGSLDDDDLTGWGNRRGMPHTATFVPRSAPAARGASRLRIAIDQAAGQGQVLGRFRISYTSDEPGSSPSRTVPDDIRAIVSMPPVGRTIRQAADLKRFYQSSCRPDAADLAAWEAALVRSAEITDQHAAHAVRQRVASRPTFVHLRGDPARPGKRVGPAALPLGAGPARPEDPREEGTSPSRLDLALWVAHRDNPLTSRVAMNDAWQHLFGHGLVRTPDDFGRQGEPPTHPELLDWLADEFVRGDWGRKRMIRLIVTSSAYRQDASVRPELALRDPENRLLSRQGRYRLEAEAIRDAALAASGLLERRIGGPSFGLGDHQPRPWQNPRMPEPGPRAELRRALYTFSARTSPSPILGAFDLPGAEAACTGRLRDKHAPASPGPAEWPRLRRGGLGAGGLVLAGGGRGPRGGLRALPHPTAGRGGVAYLAGPLRRGIPGLPRAAGRRVGVARGRARIRPRPGAGGLVRRGAHAAQRGRHVDQALSPAAAPPGSP